MNLATGALVAFCLLAATTDSTAQTGIDGSPFCPGPTCWPQVTNTVDDPGITVSWYQSNPGDSQGDDCGPCVPCGAVMEITVSTGSFLMYDARPDSVLEPPGPPARCAVITRNNGDSYYATIRNNCGAAAYTNTDTSALSIYDQVGSNWISQGEALVGCECFSE